jgi:CheY-like chemotaxis protein
MIRRLDRDERRGSCVADRIGRDSFRATARPHASACGAGALDSVALSADDGPLPTRVLIVDDAEVFRQAARELLELRGYAVVGEVGRVAEAMEMVDRLAPAAVLLDLRLPDGDGFTLCAALTLAHPELAVLLTSADRTVPDPGQVSAAGARGFVLKSRLAAADLAQFWPSP